MSQYINIGLDFGTHQTKVCIEDSSDSRNITYTFLKFFEGSKDETYFLPSIVQRNNDDTLTYGRYDYSSCRSYTKSIPRDKKPHLTLPPQPQILLRPDRPTEKKTISIDEFISRRINKKIDKQEHESRKKLKPKQREKYKAYLESDHKLIHKYRIQYNEYLKEIEQEKRTQIDKWIRESYRVDTTNKERHSAWEKECELLRTNYQKELEKWNRPQHTTVYQIYRYFKIASFSKGYEWDMDVNPIKLSIWYLTYVLFQIYKVVDEDSTIQFGIPQSISDNEHSKWQIKNAEQIFYSAYRLYVSYGTEEAFLNAKISELNGKTRLECFKEPDYDIEPGLLVLPEAFASLITLTKEGKISRGLNLLMDIGGGSTDISLFNVIVNNRGEYLPNISHILSVHKGLNHLFRLYIEDNENVSIEKARDIFEKDPECFEDYIYAFRIEIAKEIESKIYFPLIEASSKSGLSITQVKEALYNRPVIYTGGGGVYDSFIDFMYVFTDAMSMSKDFISMRNITNKGLTESELSILSVSYGLAVPQMREPQMTPLRQLFDHIRMESERGGNYEHGISDIE